MISFLRNYDGYPDALEVWQAALILRVAQDMVRRHIRTRKILAYRIGRGYIIPKSELRSYILAHASKKEGTADENR